MIPRSVLMFCVTLCTPVTAFGSGAGEGLNLSWDDCGGAGVSSKAFACNTTADADVLVASMRPPAGINQMTRMEAQIDVRSSTASLPDWWKHNSNPQGAEPLACRGLAGMEIDVEADLQSCLDAWEEDVTISHHYDIGFIDADRARLLVTVDVSPVERVLTTGTEYALFRVNLTHDKATGSGSCTGCATSACIVFNEAKLTNGSSVVRVNTASDRNYVTWQSVPAGCPGSTGVVRSTWGMIRTLYR